MTDPSPLPPDQWPDNLNYALNNLSTKIGEELDFAGDPGAILETLLIPQFSIEHKATYGTTVLGSGETKNNEQVGISFNSKDNFLILSADNFKLTVRYGEESLSSIEELHIVRNINNLNKEVTFFSDEIFYRRRHGFSNELVRRLTYVYDNGEPYLDGHTIGITDYIEINYDFDTKNSTTTKTSDMAMESVADRVRANIYVSYKMQARPIFSDMTKKDPRKMIATKLIKKYTSELELTDEFINQEKRTYTCEDSTVNYTLETLSVGDGFVYALSKKEKGKDSKPLITTPMAIQKDNLIILGSGKTKFTLILRKINNVTYVVGVTQ